MENLNQQKKIADTLKSFDDQLIALRDANNTLEQLLESIFRSWFVNFEPVHARAKEDEESDEFSGQCNSFLQISPRTDCFARRRSPKYERTRLREQHATSARFLFIWRLNEACFLFRTFSYRPSRPDSRQPC